MLITVLFCNILGLAFADDNGNNYPMPSARLENCPPGSMGIPPHCESLPLPECPQGYTGEYPYCIPPTPELGPYVPPAPTQCPYGTFGQFPNCEVPPTPECPYPNCQVPYVGGSSPFTPQGSQGSGHGFKFKLRASAVG